MTRKSLVIAVALAGFMAMTPSALARPTEALVRPRTVTLSPLSRTYLRLYHEVARRDGDRVPGRNIVRDGLRDGSPPSARHLRGSIVVLRRILAPPAPAPVTIPSTPAVAVVAQTVTPSPSSSGGLPACTWQPESGGSYTARNPSSGAGGKYQIMPSTWQAYGGTGDPATAPPAEQDAVAQRVYAGQGPSAWVNC